MQTNRYGCIHYFILHTRTCLERKSRQRTAVHRTKPASGFLRSLRRHSLSTATPPPPRSPVHAAIPSFRFLVQMCVVCDDGCGGVLYRRYRWLLRRRTVCRLRVGFVHQHPRGGILGGLHRPVLRPSGESRVLIGRDTCRGVRIDWTGHVPGRFDWTRHVPRGTDWTRHVPRGVDRARVSGVPIIEHLRDSSTSWAKVNDPKLLRVGSSRRF